MVWCSQKKYKHCYKILTTKLLLKLRTIFINFLYTYLPSSNLSNELNQERYLFTSSNDQHVLELLKFKTN